MMSCLSLVLGGSDYPLVTSVHVDIPSVGPGGARLNVTGVCRVLYKVRR